MVELSSTKITYYSKSDSSSSQQENKVIPLGFIKM